MNERTREEGAMRRMTIVGTAAALTLTASLAAAQVKTVTVKTEVLTATVEAIDRGSRQVTVKKSDGNHEVFYVPAAVKRFDMLKVGDRITAKHYENIVLRVKRAGEKDVEATTGDVVGVEGRPAGTMSHQRTITATIVAIDPAVPSITFTGPRDWKYSTRVKDREALAKVKVGDKVDITWTEATLVSIDEVK
jgi:hypothetical protein